MATTPGTPELERLARERARANHRFFEQEAARTAELCHRMAERFARGGRLIAIGLTPAAHSDARHVAVEFVHPVIVGKRALPAMALTAAEASEHTLELLAGPEDIVMAFGDGFEPGQPGDRTTGARTAANSVLDAALDRTGERGCLTIGYGGVEGKWSFAVRSADPFVRQEVTETHYHILWELVHLFFEHRGLLKGRRERERHDPGASRFLYPFLAEDESDLDSVLSDVRSTIVHKSEEITALREDTVRGGASTIERASAAVRERSMAGGTVLVFGNGGSATDAMDLVADLRSWPGHERAALDLSSDPAILTAIGNDIGQTALFARQIIACGRSADVAIAISTSGNSGNVVEALAEARRRDLLTIALVGYDGGRVAADRLADFVIVSRSEHIPRIQEAQATVYHALRALIG